MPEPRLNGYGEVIQPLVDVRSESMLHRPANEKAIAGMLALLRERWPEILRRGWYGEIVLAIVVRDGIIEQDISVTERQAHRVRE